MKGIILKLSLLLAVVIATVSLEGCSDDAFNDLPTPLAKFVEQYFPGSGVSEYSVSADAYHVKLKDGPGMTFDREYKWMTINGYGETLPQVLLFDQLPPAMYEYIQGNGLLQNAMSMERNSKTYTLVLLDTTIYYDIETGKITEGTPS